LSSDFVSCTYQLLQKKVSLLELKNSELNHEREQLAERARAAQVSISSSV